MMLASICSLQNHWSNSYKIFCTCHHDTCEIQSSRSIRNDAGAYSKKVLLLKLIELVFQTYKKVNSKEHSVCQILCIVSLPHKKKAKLIFWAVLFNWMFFLSFLLSLFLSFFGLCTFLFSGMFFCCTLLFVFTSFALPRSSVAKYVWLTFLSFIKTQSKNWR